MDRLDTWEHDLATRFSSVQLVGELNLTRDDFERLANDVCDVVRWYGDQRLISRYPCCLATFLVFCGVYGYEQGNFWSSVTSRLGARVSTSDIGRGFERVLNELRLERFPQFDEQSAQRYVSRILAHGGVPDYCLGDLFDLIEHALTRPEWRSLSVRELIAEWQARRFSFVQIDVPIQRFLTFGGPAARDFLQRSIDMVEPALSSGAPIESVQTGLPIRIGDGFNQWLKQRSGRESGFIETGMRRRFAAPQLSIDPWGSDGLLLRLPSQPASGTMQQVKWSIGFGTRTRVIDVTPGRGAEISRESEIILEEPAARWDVTLLADGAEQATWHFSGLPVHRPILIFDAESLEAIRTSDALPSGEVILLHPVNDNLSIISGGTNRPLEIQEHYPPLWGRWRNFGVSRVVLPAGTSLAVQRKDDERTTTFSIRERDVRVGQPQSDIEQHRVHALWASDDRLPVVSRVPSIMIPRSDSAPVTADRWTIVLDSRNGSVPAGRIVRNVSELESSLGSNGSLIVDLAQRDLLGTDGIGTFHVTVRGPLGKDARFDFALVPGLAVRGHASHRTINREADASAQIELRSNVLVAARCDDSSVILQRVQDGYNITTAGKAVSLQLSPAQTTLQTNAAEPAVELHVPIAGVRWTLVGVGGDGELTWSSQPITLPQELIATGETALLIEGYTAGTPSVRGDLGTLRLALLDASGQQQQVLTFPIRGPRVWAPLQEFSTTILSSNDASMTIVMDIIDTTGAVMALGRSVLRLTRDLVIEKFLLRDAGLIDGSRKISMSWTQPHRVNNRVLRMTSLARPWELPHVIEIPDTVLSSYSFETNDQLLPPGPYQAEIIVIDPWAGVPDHRQSETTFHVQIGSTDEIATRADAPATTSIELLEQFMLAPNGQRLRELHEMLANEDPSPAITVFSALTAKADSDVLEDESVLEAAIIELREALIGHSCLLHAIVDRLGMESAWNDPSNSNLARILVGLGLPQAKSEHLRSMLERFPAAERAVLEREAPWLLLARVGEQLLANDTQREDVELILGHEPLATLAPPVDSGGIRIHPWHGRVDAIIDAFGYSSKPSELRTPVVQLEMIRPMLGLIPTGILDHDSYVLATFDWLITLNHPKRAGRKQRIENWLFNAVPRIESALVHLDDELTNGRPSPNTDGIHAAIAVLSQRLASELSGIGFLPYVVGGTALIQRLIARDPAMTGAIRLSESQLMEYGRFAALAAPGIYTHDLCLFDLLVTNPLAETDQSNRSSNEMEDVNDEQ